MKNWLQISRLKLFSFLLLILIFIGIIPPPVLAKNAAKEIVSSDDSIKLNKNGLTLDSLYGIVINNKIDYAAKKEIIMSCQPLLYFDRREEQKAILNRMLGEAKAKKNYDDIALWYCELHTQAFAWNDRDFRYIDSISVFIDKVKDVNVMGRYYYFLSQKLIESDTINKVQYLSAANKAIEYSERAKNFNRINIIFIWLSLREYNSSDFISLKHTLSQIEKYVSKYPEEQPLRYALIIVKSRYYRMYYNENKEPKWADSALFYTKEVVRNTEDKTNREKKAAYMVLATLYINNHPENWQAEADSCFAKYRQYLSEKDTLNTIFLLIAESSALVQSKRYDEVEKKVQQLTKLIQKFPIRRPSERVVIDFEYYKLMFRIAQQKGDYKQALDYNLLMMNVNDKRINEERQKLIAQYNYELSEAEKDKIAKESDLRYRINTVLFIALVLAIILSFLLFHIHRRKSKEKEDRLISEQERMKAEQAKLKAEQERLKAENELQEERSANAELEKYDILTDMHLKELELSGKNEELEALYKNKKELDSQLEDYRIKIETYEKRMNSSDLNDSTLLKQLIDDISEQIRKRLADKVDYINSFEKIKSDAPSILRANYDSSMSQQVMKYCLCFAIGMKPADVSEIFCIEPSSVHAMRSRLKRRLNLSVGTDLDMWLRNMIVVE